MLLIGYARVSMAERDTVWQTDTLSKAGGKRIFKDTASGTKAVHPGLAAALVYLRDGNVLVVWQLDRLERSLPQLIETLEAQCITFAFRGGRSRVAGEGSRRSASRLLKRKIRPRHL